jgi:alpha-galactosidase
MVSICIIGASYNWTPKLVSDLMVVFPEKLDIRLVDLDPQAAQLCKEWGEAASKQYGRQDTFAAFTDRRRALPGADAVFITISTGGLDMMEHDIAIPEKYGIFATVGDTAGPGGWSRSIRNIPVFEQFARDFEELCPTAFVANYTNPLSSLTATLARLCPNPVVGLCHSYFEMKDVLQHIFQLDDWGELSLSIAGMNHFTWLIDFKVGRKDGYTELRKRIGNGSLRDLLPKETGDDIGYASKHRLCAELYETYGYLPYPGDRHTCEFLSYTISNDPPRVEAVGPDGEIHETIQYCQIERTSIRTRRAKFNRFKRRMEMEIRQLSEGALPPNTKSRETSAEMARAYLTNKPMTEVVNTANIGQIPGLPLHACVESFGVIDGLGVRPVMVNNIPEHLLEIMRPQAVNQVWITEGVITRNKNLLLQALYNDPQCRGLKPGQIREMAEELFEANRDYVRF